MKSMQLEIYDMQCQWNEKRNYLTAVKNLYIHLEHTDNVRHFEALFSRI